MLTVTFSPAPAARSLNHPLCPPGPTAKLRITAPSRLHFGLLRVGDGKRRFGGAGVMLERPGLELESRPAEAFSSLGCYADRVAEFAERWSRFHQIAIPQVEVQVLTAPPQHSGLGVGTQLGLSVAALLNAVANRPADTPEVLARSVDRGLRSAVGAYGFHTGGLIIERGKSPTESLSPLDLQIDLPPDWRFILARPKNASPLVFGQREREVFAGLTAQPNLEDALESILRERLAPAAVSGDFAGFADAVEDYGRQAGSYFASVQGGCYNGSTAIELVERMKSLGARGVGQSSWGPTLFSCAENETQACELVSALDHSTGGELDIELSEVSAHGAMLRN